MQRVLYVCRRAIEFIRGFCVTQRRERKLQRADVPLVGDRRAVRVFRSRQSENPLL